MVVVAAVAVVVMAVVAVVVVVTGEVVEWSCHRSPVRGRGMKSTERVAMTWPIAESGAP